MPGRFERSRTERKPIFYISAGSLATGLALMAGLGVLKRMLGPQIEAERSVALPSSVPVQPHAETEPIVARQSDAANQPSFSRIQRAYNITVVLYAFDVAYLALNFYFKNRRTLAVPGVLSIAQGIVFAIIVTTVVVAKPGPFANWSIILHVVNTFTLCTVDFASIYWAYSSHAHACMNVALTKADSIYYTLTTLTTVGYGDIAPVTEHCREIVSMQMIAGLVLLAIVLALMVTRISEAKVRSRLRSVSQYKLCPVHTASSVGCLEREP